MAVRFGEYTTATGEPYSYHLTYERAPRGIKWRAIVRDTRGALVAVPKGILAAAPQDETIDERLRREVARAIDLALDASDR